MIAKGLTNTAPRDLAMVLEHAPQVPREMPGRSRPDRERFAGWAVVGLTFDSGHVLGLRRFPVSSLGPGYASVWHRTPQGEWSFWATVPGELACARYAGTISVDSGEKDIHIVWPEPHRLVVTMDDPGLWWEITVAGTPVTRSLGSVARVLPERLRRSDPALRLFGVAAGTMLGTGRLALSGRMPNRQGFHVMPSHLWRIVSSSATLDGVDLGTPAPLPEQATVGDFRIPQRGLVAVAAPDFEPLDPRRHSTLTTRRQSSAAPLSQSSSK